MPDYLVERARSGDPDAFDALVQPEMEILVRLAAAIVLDRDHARDVVQESLIRAWRHLDQLRDPAAFHAWLRRIVINTSRNALRRDRAAPSITASSPVDPIGPTDDRLMIEEALKSLDADHRMVVALHYLDDRSVDSIGRLLGIPSGTVKSRLHTARARLRAALEENDGSP